MKKHLFKFFYAAAIILILLFIIFIVFLYGKYQEFAQNPLVELVPFSWIVRDYALKFLLPAAICAVIGFILHRISKK